jgi:PadR family transcriptional regulator PadR
MWSITHVTTPALRATLPTVEVLSLLLEASADGSPWAARISEQTGLGKSTVSQILTRLAALAWIATWNEQGPHPGRPPRIFCTLTGEGRRQAKKMLAASPTPRPRWREYPKAATSLSEEPAQSDAHGQVQPRPSAPQQQPRASHPRFKGLWPVRLAEVEKRQADKAADAAIATGKGIPVSEGDSLEHLTKLKEARKVLQSMNQQLTTGFLGRSAVAPIHREQHEEIIHLLLMETISIRGKVLKAHNY